MVTFRVAGSGAVLVPGEREWLAPATGERFPAVLGIPDFRPPGWGPQVTPEVERLLAAYPTAGFEELLTIRTPSLPVTDPALLAKYRAYLSNMMPRGFGFYRMAMAAATTAAGPVPRGVGLGVGCGAGASVLAMAAEFAETVGIDPSLPDLILARKAAEEAGLADRVTLIQATAQAMPLPAESVDFALAEDVLEHVMDLDGAMREIGRVLRRPGLFVGNSVNRFNMLRPEPHVNVWFFGFLPRRYQDYWAMRLASFENYTARTRLPSYGELQRALCQGVGAGSFVTFPDVTFYGMPGFLNRVLDVIERLPLVRPAVLAIFPSHLAVGQARAP
jgi:ubiquinone/menaquinone biosynthesis C-methylase UbiE